MKYFGTDGFRGKANEGLTVDHAFKIGKFLGEYYHVENQESSRKSKCVIGKDTRRSSYMLEYALAAGLSATGLDVYLMHVTTTPSVAYVTRTDEFDFGIMITASHNPYYDNGIKIFNKMGYKMEDEILEKIEKYIDGEIVVNLAKDENIGVIVDYIQGRNKYINYLTSATSNSFRSYKIALDCSNGSASRIAKNAFEMLGAKTYAINDDPNGFNINLECGSVNIQQLQNYVIENNLDCGFAFDGDADRCIAVDENGNIVDGDMILYILSSYLKRKGQLNDDIVVATVMTNMGIEKALNKQDIHMIRTQVGDKYISKELQENNYSVGGEQSGHIILNKISTSGDGILTALILMEIIVTEKTLLSYLGREVNLYPQKQCNIKVYGEGKLLEDKIFKNMITNIENELGLSGRVLVRKSGTEPLIRVLIEAEDEDICEDKLNIIKEYANEFYLK